MQKWKRKKRGEESSRVSVLILEMSSSATKEEEVIEMLVSLAIVAAGLEIKHGKTSNQAGLNTMMKMM